MALKASSVISTTVCSQGALAVFLYFLLNLALTLLNKLLLQKIKLPYILTALHATACWLGCAILLYGKSRRREVRIQKTRLSRSDHVKLVLFSVLYSLNIGVSNVSLYLTPLPLHQLLRATTPAITALVLRLFDRHTHYTLSAYAALTLVVLGVVLATIGPVGEKPSSASTFSSSSSTAILLTLLGAFLASIKSIVAAQLQRKPSFNSTTTASGCGSGLAIGLGPLELVRHISLLAFLEALLCAWGAGEFRQLSPFLLSSSSFSPSTKSPSGRLARHEEANLNSHSSPLLLPFLLLLNPLTALSLNVASFEANRRVGALGITIAGNVKQVLLIVAGGLFGAGQIGGFRPQQLQFWSWVGVIGTIGGSAWWIVEERRRSGRARELIPGDGKERGQV